MSKPTSLEDGLPKTQRTAVKLGGTALLILSFQTLGIIYSDIGTSPLYTLNGIWPASGPVPSKEDVIGGISAILWAFTLLPFIKYVLISLRFGTSEGEGGTFALFQGLFPPEIEDFDSDRSLTGDSTANKPPSRRSAIIKEKFRIPLLVWCLFGTSLTMADGVFTPAVSVTSAVAGISVAKPSVASSVTPISIAILLVLFFMQRFGVAKLGFMFAPVALIWFLLIAGAGIYNITTYPGIFRAFDPSRAVMLFVRTGNYDLLSGIFLALTGSEAMFANLGQFNALSIQISFSCFVYPALFLAYLGQGARLIVDGETVLSNVFYQSIPGPANGAFYWISFVFALLATIIASQAMITATFSLIQQVVNMRALPPVLMIFTSETIQGQVYIPVVNWLLMIVTIAVVGAFKSSTALANAYGFAVATVMISTTTLLAVQMRFVKHWPLVIGIGFFLLFGFFDGLFWGAALKKVPQGAWVPLMIGTILTILMVFWTWAKGLEDRFDGANRQNLRHFIHTSEKGDAGKVVLNLGTSSPTPDIDEEDDTKDENTHYYISDAIARSKSEKEDVEERHELARIPTCAVFHKLTKGKGVPHTFVGFIRQWPALPRVVIFLSFRVLPINRVPLESRYVVDKVRSVEGFYGVSYYLGFRDKFDFKIEDVIERVCELEQNSPETIAEIRRICRTATHIVPHYHVVSRNLNVRGGKVGFAIDWVRRFLIEDIYRRFSTMFPETANWLTSADEIIRVGINAII